MPRIKNVTDKFQTICNETIAPGCYGNISEEVAGTIAGVDLFDVDLSGCSVLSSREGNISVKSFFGANDSVGHLAYTLSKYLLRNKKITPHIFVADNKMSGEIPQDVVNGIANSSKVACDIGISILPPDKYYAIPAKYKICLTFWESTNIPESWVDGLNSYYDEVWTLSEENKQSFIECGVSVPVVNVGCGYDPDEYYVEKGRDYGVFRIGTAGLLSFRKGVDISIRAFKKAFNGNNNAVMEIKSRVNGVGNSVCHTDELIAENLHVIEDEWNVATMRAWYNSLDLYVAPTRFEGFGLTPIEAAACGAQVCVTNASGCKHYAKKMHPLRTTGTMPSLIDGYGDCGLWYVPDEDSLAETMKKCYHNRYSIDSGATESGDSPRSPSITMDGNGHNDRCNGNLVAHDVSGFTMDKMVNRIAKRISQINKMRAG